MTNKDNIFRVLTGGRTYTEKQAADASSLLSDVLKHYGENSDIYNPLLGAIAGGVAGGSIGKGGLASTGLGVAGGGALGYLVNEMLKGGNTPGQQQSNYTPPPSGPGLTQEGIKMGGQGIVNLALSEAPQGMHSMHRGLMPIAGGIAAAFPGKTLWDEYKALPAAAPRPPVTGAWNKTKDYAGNKWNQAVRGKDVIKGAWGKTHWAGKKGMALFALLELLGATQYEGRKLMQSSDTPANPSK